MNLLFAILSKRCAGFTFEDGAESFFVAVASQTCDLFQSHCSETLVTLTCFAWQFKDGQWKVSCRGHLVENIRRHA